MAVQLTEGWWKTAWPSDTLPPSFDKMKKTIKATKAAKRGLSVMAYIVLLDEVLDVIQDLVKEAEKQFRTVSINKVKAKKMLADFAKFIEKEKSGVKPDAKPIVVFKKPFAIALGEKVGDKGLEQKLGRLDVELEIMSWLVNELRDKNAESLLNKAIQKEFDRSLATAAKIYNKYTSDGPMTKSQRETLGSLLNGISKELAENVRKIPAEVLRKIGLTAKMAKEYKIDKGVSIATGVVGTGLAGAGIALPGTPLLAIAVTIRSAAATASEIAGLRRKIEKKIETFNKYLIDLRTMFSTAEDQAKKMSKSEGAAEFTIATMNSALGIDVLPTMRKAKVDLKDIEGKLVLLAVKSQKMQKEVLDAIDGSNKFKKKMVEAIGPKQLAKSIKNYDKSEKDLNDTLDAAYEIAERLNNADDKVVELRRKFKELAQPSLGLRRAQKLMDNAIQLAGAAGGLYDTTVMPDESQVKKAAGVLVAIAGAYVEAGNTVKEWA